MRWDEYFRKRSIKKAIQYAKSQKWIGDEFEKMFGFIR